MRYKVGDEVIITANASAHRFTIGTSVYIQAIHDNSYHACAGTSWFINDDDCMSVDEYYHPDRDKEAVVVDTLLHNFTIGDIVTIKIPGVHGNPCACVGYVGHTKIEQFVYREQLAILITKPEKQYV